MKILFVHNNYASNNSGEEHASQGLSDLLESHGHVVDWYRKSSDKIGNSLYMKIVAFFLGIYNPRAVRELKSKIKLFKPDVIQVQNVYPFISPAILKMIKKLHIPIVMRCPNYRLFCPTGLHLDEKDEVCEKCLDGLKELNAVLKNCEKNRFKSIGYAIRNFFGRTIWGLYRDVDRYIVQSNFQKNKFIQNGIPEGKIYIVPGLTPSLYNFSINKNPQYVSFIGRISIEKGILEFLSCAKELPQIPFVVIGEITQELQYLKNTSSKNVDWVGFQSGDALDQWFQNSKIVVVPSKWYEGFPNVITRAMKHSRPVITSNLGAMSSIIDDKVNGLLFEAGNHIDLKEKVNFLYQNQKLCEEYGKNAFEKAKIEYSSDTIYNDLLKVYKDI